jgi:uncharacterized protein (TIGR02145 family)
MPLRPHTKFSAAIFLLGLLGVALLSCDTTSSTNASNIVTGRWAMDSIRMPDSATWTVHANAGTFSLGFPTDSSFSVTDTLPAPLGTDTLVIQAWTLSLRTTIANCWSDKAGNLTLYLPTTKDSLAIHLLLKLDSLRHRNSATWGSRKDSKPTQIASLIKAYAALILASDTTFSRFPARHPVGIDTVGVIDQLLILASHTSMTAADLLQKLGALDTAKVHARARTLALAGLADSLVLYPVISTSLVFSGVPYDLEMVEDSLTKIPLTVSGLTTTDSAILKVVSADTSILASVQCTVHAQDTLRLQAKSNAYGGPFKVSLTLSKGTTSSMTTAVFATVASRNDAPTFAGASSLLVVSNAMARSYAGWIDSISPGASNESGQKISFQVQVESGADLFSVAPSVDTAGTLTFMGKSSSSGAAMIRLRAKDNGDSTGGNVDSSAWKEATITFDVAPVLTLPLHADSTWEGIAVSAGTATLSDLETSAGNLTFTWAVLDSALLLHDSVYVGGSGSSRNIQFHPLAHKWGSCLVTFTLADSQWISVTDTIRLTVLPVNHAPTLGMSLPTFVYSYKGAQSLGSVVWDDVDTSQRGRVGVAWTTASDSQFASLSMDSTGKRVMITAKLDTAVSVSFKIRARDSAGTAHGGVDTGAWSSVLTVMMVDSMWDANGNGFHVRTMPDGKVWMTSNYVGSDAINGIRICIDSNCAKGAAYTWAEAMGQSSVDSISALSSQYQGVCPSSWHIPDSTEWIGLLNSASESNDGLGSSAAWTKLKSNDNTWYFQYSTTTEGSMHYTTNYYPGSDAYGFHMKGFVYSNGFVVYTCSSYWTPVYKKAVTYIEAAAAIIEKTTNMRPVRCVLNQ